MKFLNTISEDTLEIEGLSGSFIVSRFTNSGKSKEIGTINLYSKHEKSINKQVNDFVYSCGINPVTTDIMLQEADTCECCGNLFEHSSLSLDVDGKELICEKCCNKRNEDFEEWQKNEAANESGYQKDSWTYGIR